MERNMAQKYLEILKKFKGKRAGIFIDDANLFYIQKELGWKIDWMKLKDFLSRYLKPTLFTYYLGMPASGKARLENEGIKTELEEIGFKVITKTLKKIYIDNQKQEFKHKCNFDVEIAFDIARNIDKLDLVIIMSGDSDFLEAKNFCLENRKSFLVMCFERRVAWEIRRIYHIFLEDIKEYIKKR